MSPRTLSALAAAGAVAALGIYAATGQIPDATGGTCVVSTVLAPCILAHHFSVDGGEDCDVNGPDVYRHPEQRLDADAGVDGGEGGSLCLTLRDGGSLCATPLPDSTREVPCDSLIRPDKAMTSRKARVDAESGCWVGDWRNVETGETWNGRWEESRKCRPLYEPVGTVAPVVERVILGRDDTRERLCAAIPETCPAADGGGT